MASFHCRACSGEFASEGAFDRHLLNDNIMVETKERTGPICVGERDGAPLIDPNLTRLRALAKERFGR